MDIHTLRLVGGQDGEFATFVESEDGDRCSLTCKHRGKEITASADDFFEALCMIRLQLELEGLIPFCYGASLDVYPSEMSRSMAAGTVAYKLYAGRHASRNDLKNIFAEGPDVIPAGVARQLEHFNEWVSSKRV